MSSIVFNSQKPTCLRPLAAVDGSIGWLELAVITQVFAWQIVRHTRTKKPLRFPSRLLASQGGLASTELVVSGGLSIALHSPLELRPKSCRFSRRSETLDRCARGHDPRKVSSHASCVA